MNIAILQIDHSVLYLLRIDIADIHRNLTAGQFLAEQSGLLQGIDDAIGVNAALKTERSVCRETVTASRLTNPRGMEVGRFEYHIFRSLVGTTTLAAKHTSDTHGILGIADGEVAV